jgi:hypothetical protein
MSADPFKDLLEQAFSTARESGKREWHRMIVAVLRNRLLQLTNYHFTTEDFGARSLVELVERYEDLITIDRSARPLVIEWRGPLAATPGSGRVRPDLWQAMIDLASGLQYEWDTAAGRARPVEAADPQRRLPTVDAATLATWRNAFVAVQEATHPDPRDRERLATWARASHGRQGLPGALRALWNDHLKHEVVARLTSWFHASGLVLPDLFCPPAERAR